MSVSSHVQAAIASAQGHGDEEGGFHRYYPPAFGEGAEVMASGC